MAAAFVVTAARILLSVLLSLSIAPAIDAQRPAAADPGITGRVLAPDGSPVTQGNVALTSVLAARATATAAIDRTGHFRIVPDSSGPQRLFIAAPGFALHRINVTVPSSRRMALPEITLLEATFFHARFESKDGEPLAAAALRRRSIDRDGVTIPDPLDHVREQIETDGSITIGPLPTGLTMLAFDRQPWAQTRLRDLDVAGPRPLIEGGTIAIDPGAQLVVDVLDGAAQPVPRHDVWLEDAVRPSPLSFPVAKTDESGRAVFNRLAAGRYRVWTRTAERCNNQELATSRLVSTSGSGVSRTRIVIGGRASLRITSALGPVTGRSVLASPDAPQQTPWQSPLMEMLPRSRIASRPPAACNGVTDADGQVTLTPFPPGPSELRIRLFNSIYITRITVPEGGRELVIPVPDGLLPVRVVDQATHQPISTAQVIWTGGGGRVETFVTPNGDALLESVGNNGGTLTISASDYQTLEGRFDETPGTLQEVALTRSPSTRLSVRVIDSEGKPLAAALVERVSRGPADVADFVVADASGAAAFADAPAGQLQFTARAEGFVPATVRVPEAGRASVVITLTREPKNGA